MQKSLIIQGGWEGHFPQQIADIFGAGLRERGFDVTISDTLDVLGDVESLKQYDLIFPFWTMGELTKEQSASLCGAIRSGVGLGGIHGGMGDAFRGDIDYEWMVGGHFVGHPHVGDYGITIRDSDHPITAGLPAAFHYNSEQYYMLTDPGIHVLADSEYVYDGSTATMPIAWTKMWGKGRVFYSALGHQPAEFTDFPEAFQLTMQGLVWAARPVENR